jgi:hypothetical protein
MKNTLTINTLIAAFAVIWMIGVSSATAEVTVNNGERRVGEIQADLNALGTETSQAAMQCWQGGKEIFSTQDYNTVLLGGIAGDSAITLKNNTDGAQTLAISLENGLCFVTIEP